MANEYKDDDMVQTKTFRLCIGGSNQILGIKNNKAAVFSGDDSNTESTKLKVKLTPKGFQITDETGKLCLCTDSEVSQG